MMHSVVFLSDRLLPCRLSWQAFVQAIAKILYIAVLSWMEHSNRSDETN